MSQSRTMSVAEATTNTVGGFIIAVAVQAWALPLWGFYPTLAENVQITAVFMAISAIRSYVFRRIFNWFEKRKETPPTPVDLLLMIEQAGQKEPTEALVRLLQA